MPMPEFHTAPALYCFAVFFNTESLLLSSKDNALTSRAKEYTFPFPPNPIAQGEGELKT